MRWSMPAPIYAIDGNKLPILPNEIYLQIIDFVHYSIDWDEDDRRRSLSNLALSCVLFRGFIVPRIFKSLHFYGDQDDPKLHSAVNSAAFCRALNSGKEPATSLAQYVEECNLVNWNSEAANPAINAAFMQMYCRAFLRMPNLHELSLSNVFIDAHLLKTICKLRGLRFLALIDIDFPPNVAERLLNKTPPITSLRLDWSKIESPNFGEESLDSTIARVVNAADLQRLSAARCAQVLPLLPQTSDLVELKLRFVESTTELWNIIGCLRALTTLEMMFVTVRQGTTHQLIASSLPNLRHLMAPPSFFSIIGNRSLSYLNLIDGIQSDQTKLVTQLSSQISEISEYSTQFSAGLTSLLIPLEFYSIGPFFEKFPDLQSLTIMSGHPNFTRDLYRRNDYDGLCFLKSIVNEVATKWPPAPSVKSLKLKMEVIPLDIRIKYLYDLELQCDLIGQIVVAFPNVHRVQFFEYLDWTRQLDGEKWTGYIPFEFHSHIRWNLKHGHYVIKDVCGLLQPFLTPDVAK